MAENKCCWTCGWCGDGEELNDYGYCWRFNGEVESKNEILDKDKGCEEWTPKARERR